MKTLLIVFVIALPIYFAVGGLPTDSQRGDANSDSSVNIGDLVYLVQYIFAHGPAPKKIDCFTASFPYAIAIYDSVKGDTLFQQIDSVYAPVKSDLMNGRLYYRTPYYLINGIVVDSNPHPPRWVTDDNAAKKLWEK